MADERARNSCASSDEIPIAVPTNTLTRKADLCFLIICLRLVLVIPLRRLNEFTEEPAGEPQLLRKK